MLFSTALNRIVRKLIVIIVVFLMWPPFSHRQPICIYQIHRATIQTPILKIFQRLLVDLDEVLVLRTIHGFVVVKTWKVLWGGLRSPFSESRAELILRCAIERSGIFDKFPLVVFCYRFGCAFVESSCFVGLGLEFLFEVVPSLVVFVGAAVYDRAPFVGLWKVMLACDGAWRWRLCYPQQWRWSVVGNTRAFDRCEA